MVISFITRYWPAFVSVTIVAIILMMVRCSDRAQDNAVIQARDAGASQVREQAATETLNRTLEAINAEENIRRNSADRNAICLRYSRTPENC